MRLLLVGVAFALVALVLVPISRTARADSQTRVFQISCLPEINLFEIRDFGYSDELSGLVNDANYDLTKIGHAFYSPILAYEALFDPSNKYRESPTEAPTMFECTLQTDAVALYVVPHGSRGPPDDILVSLSIGGRWVVDNVPFALCEDRGPITRLAYEGGLNLVSFDGRFGGVWPDKIDSTDVTKNARRTFSYNGSTLSVWDSSSETMKPLPGPLTAIDLDYFQSTSSQSYGEPAANCS